jgi:RimJ/RimL family protein N-acetyltransferase
VGPLNISLPDIPTETTSDRLLLRPYRVSDAPAYFHMLRENWTHLWEFMPPNLVHAQNEADVLTFIEWQIAEWQRRSLFILGFWDKSSAEYLGEVYLANADWEVPCIEVGYFVVQRQTGKGYATEAARAAVRIAFEHLQVQRVELQCAADNEKSARVARRCGFTLEGRLRQRSHKKDGTLVDRLWFGLLRSEYLASRTGSDPD